MEPKSLAVSSRTQLCCLYVDCVIENVCLLRVSKVKQFESFDVELSCVVSRRSYIIRIWRLPSLITLSRQRLALSCSVGRHSRQDGLADGLFSVADKKFLPVAVQGSQKYHRHEMKRVKAAMLAVMQNKIKSITF